MCLQASELLWKEPVRLPQLGGLGGRLEALAEDFKVQSDLFTATPFVPSMSVTSSPEVLLWMQAMYHQDRLCSQKTCHCDLEVTLSKVIMTESDCSLKFPLLAIHQAHHSSLMARERLLKDLAEVPR